METCYKSITVALFGGLLDNFCKNDPFILIDASATNTKYRKGFYDMDSGAGGDNNSEITVPAQLYLKGVDNDDTSIKEVYAKSDTSIVSGVDNKLILSLEHKDISSFAVANGGNPYSYFWINFRNYLYEKYKNNYSSLA